MCNIFALCAVLMLLYDNSLLAVAWNLFNQHEGLLWATNQTTIFYVKLFL